MQYILNEDEYLKLSRYGNLQVNSRVKEAVEAFDKAVCNHLRPTARINPYDQDSRHVVVEIDLAFFKEQMTRLHESVK